MAIQYMDKNGDAVGTVNDTYNITASNDQLSVAIDGGSNQVFTLTHGSARTAAQVVDDLNGGNGNTAISSAVASVVTINSANFVRIRTNSSNGATSTILVNAPSNNANSLLGFTATTYTGGANVSYTFTNTSGTDRQGIINGVETALNNAGWITISGHGTSNCLVQSSMTPDPQNLRMRVRLKDNGNNCTVISIENVFGSKATANSTSAGIQLLPQTSKTWRVIANKYQAFVTVPGSITARDYGAFGVPYLPSWLQGVVYECIWGQNNSSSDTQTTTLPTFRTSLVADITATSISNTQQIINGNVWETASASNATSQVGLQQLADMVGAGYSTAGTKVSYRWHDNSALMVDPLIGFGLTSSADECMFRGQLWDAFISNESYTIDTTLSSIDSHNWIGITDSNTGQNGSPVCQRGTLFIVTP